MTALRESLSVPGRALEAFSINFTNCRRFLRYEAEVEKNITDFKSPLVFVERHVCHFVERLRKIIVQDGLFCNFNLVLQGLHFVEINKWLHAGCPMLFEIQLLVRRCLSIEL